MSISYNLFQDVEEVTTLYNWLKDQDQRWQEQKKEGLQDYLIHEHRYKNFKPITSKSNPTIYEMNESMMKLISELQDRLNTAKSTSVCKISIERAWSKKKKKHFQQTRDKREIFKYTSCLKINYSKGACWSIGSFSFNIMNITTMLPSTHCFNIALVVLPNRVKVEIK